MKENTVTLPAKEKVENIARFDAAMLPVEHHLFKFFSAVVIKHDKHFTGQAVAYTFNELQAKEIAAALNLLETIKKKLEEKP